MPPVNTRQYVMAAKRPAKPQPTQNALSNAPADGIDVSFLGATSVPGSPSLSRATRDVVPIASNPKAAARFGIGKDSIVITKTKPAWGLEGLEYSPVATGKGARSVIVADNTINKSFDRNAFAYNDLVWSPPSGVEAAPFPKKVNLAHGVRGRAAIGFLATQVPPAHEVLMNSMVQPHTVQNAMVATPTAPPGTTKQVVSPHGTRPVGNTKPGIGGTVRFFKLGRRV